MVVDGFLWIESGRNGHRTKSGHYVTSGCTFDQGFVWENFNDTLILKPFVDLEAAVLLGL